MHHIDEGMTFDHIAGEKTETKRPSISQIMLFIAEETIMVMLMLSMIFLL